MRSPVKHHVKRTFWALGSVLLGLIVAGCGGAGVATSKTNATGLGSCTFVSAAGVLNYLTTWGSAPATASQLIEIIDADGFLVRPDSVR